MKRLGCHHGIAGLAALFAIHVVGGRTELLAQSDPPTVIDVMTIYEGQASSAERIRTVLSTARSMNVSLQRSGIRAQVRPVHVGWAPTTTSGSQGMALSSIQGTSDGVNDYVHGLRHALGADLVQFANLGSNSPAGVGSITLAPDFGFSATSGIFHIHEFGHNFGLGHLCTELPTGEHPYSYGHVLDFGGSSDGTIMVHGGSVPLFSNPNVLYQGVPAGDPDCADAARTINGDATTTGSKDIVSGYRTSVAFDPARTLRVNEGPGGVQGNHHSDFSAISTEGRFVAFTSAASNLVPGDTNGFRDVFLSDRDPDENGVLDDTAGTLVLVSTTSSGGPSNGVSNDPAISGDGRYVAFTSYATDIVPGDTNGSSDVFLWDRMSGSTVALSVNAAGQVGNGPSAQPSISADGFWVAFASAANDLVAGDANSAADVFVRNVGAGSTVLASIGQGGGQGTANSSAPGISGDGGHVAFQSDSQLTTGDTNSYSDVYVRDLSSGSTALLSSAGLGTGGANGASFKPVLSFAGRHAAFETLASNIAPGVADTNGTYDIVWVDRDSDEDGIFDEPLASPKGLVSQSLFVTGNGAGNGASQNASISSDGQLVAFQSEADDLGIWDENQRRDLFLWRVGQIVGGLSAFGDALRINQSSEESEAIGANSSMPAISGNGLHIAFHSGANNLVSGDSNGRSDIFVRDLHLPIGLADAVDVSILEGTLLSTDPLEEVAVSDPQRLILKSQYDATAGEHQVRFRVRLRIHEVQRISQLRWIYEGALDSLGSVQVIPPDSLRISVKNFTTGVFDTVDLVTPQGSHNDQDFFYGKIEEIGDYVDDVTRELVMDVFYKAESQDSSKFFKILASWVDVYTGVPSY